jgi:two-component system, NtrC family, nitrogen regulation sensor histidine kinase NtrY
VEAGVDDGHPVIVASPTMASACRARTATGWLEPYMTTREKGTGLGLAIVKRIMEEHGGRLILEDAHDAGGAIQGARVTLQFDRLAAQSSAAE